MLCLAFSTLFLGATICPLRDDSRGVIEHLRSRMKSLADRTPARFGDDLQVDYGNARVCSQNRVKRNRQKSTSRELHSLDRNIEASARLARWPVDAAQPIGEDNHAHAATDCESPGGGYPTVREARNLMGINALQASSTVIWSRYPLIPSDLCRSIPSRVATRWQIAGQPSDRRCAISWPP
jgi:hypothetical protein